MKKLLLVLMLLFSLVGCGSNDGYYEPNNSISGVSSERLVIYTVNFSLYVDDVNETFDLINNLEYDYWYDEMSQGEEYMYLNIRVLTEELKLFENDIKEFGDVKNYNLISTDITNTYYDLENDKIRLQSEYDRLLELMQDASITEIVTSINPRLFEIEQRLNEINKELTNYDTSLKYSYVNIRLSNNNVEKNFGEAIGTAFVGGWKLIGNLFYYGFIVFLYLLPITLLITSIIVVVIVIVKKRNKNTKL